MAMRAIYCDCGLVCRGTSDEELLREAQRHLEEAHPGLDGVRPNDLLAMAVDVAPTSSGPALGGEQVVLTHEGDLALVRLNRPERRNALSLELLAELRDVLEGVAKDPDVRAVILSGEGTSFCAGHDLHELRGADGVLAREIFEADADLMAALRALPQPVVASVDGPAIAGGCHLVGACDLAVASAGATFAVPGPAMGLPGTTAMVELARLIGRRRALQMLLTGAPISAEIALEWGLVNTVTQPEDLWIATTTLARACSAGSPSVTARAKRGVDEVLDRDLDDAYHLASQMTWEAIPGPDAQEGISAFLDRRPPSWSRRTGAG